MSTEFKRENRYIVIKRSDIAGLPEHIALTLGTIINKGVVPYTPKREFLVIESDWPEYEPVWKMIERRVDGASSHVGVIVAKTWLVGAPRVATLYGGDSLPNGAFLYLAPPAAPDLAMVTLQILKEARDIPDGLYARAKHLATTSAEPAKCTWTYSEHEYSWDTQCGQKWSFTDGGTPTENGMNFCHSCGKGLTFVEPEEIEE